MTTRTDTEARTARGPRFDPAEYEQRWRERWEADGLYRADDRDPRQKHYLLTMYPYPSGDLHIGHWYAATGPDIVARMRRMQGLNVMFPMGFDSFGLPAENAAIDRHPPGDLDQHEHRAHARPVPDHRLRLRLVARGGGQRPALLPLDAVAVPAVLQAPGWRIGPWRRSTGARRTRWCWRASRCWGRIGTAGAAARRSSSATWSSGSSASPTTRTSCWTSAAWTGRSRSG